MFKSFAALENERASTTRTKACITSKRFILTPFVENAVCGRSRCAIDLVKGADAPHTSDPIPFDPPVMTIDRVRTSASGFSCRLALLDDGVTLGLHRFHEVGRGCAFE